MNISRFIEFTREILAYESEFSIQDKLQTLSGQLQEMINQPQDGTHQTRAIEALNELRASVRAMNSKITPAQSDFLDGIGAWRHFGPALASEIEQRFASNTMTPAVVKSYVDETLTARKHILDNFRGVQNGLQKLGLKEEHLTPGQAQIGFTLPREMFGNSIKGLSGELKFIDRVVSDFSEAIEGEKDDAALGDLSTSDPLITLHLAAKVVVAIAGTITWMLNTYKQTLEIRQLHARSKAVGISEDMLSEFEKRVTSLIDERIELRVEQILAKRTDQNRQAELANALRIDIHGLASRMERGMTVEVRFLPPPKSDVDVENTAEDHQVYAELETIQKELKFDAITEEPFLKIEREAVEPVEKSPPSKSKKGKSKKSKNASEDGAAALD